MYVTSQIQLCSRFTGYPTRRPVHRLLSSRPVTYRLQVWVACAQARTEKLIVYSALKY